MQDHRRPPGQDLADQLRHAWRLAMPFWMFRDAGRGTVEQQIANYRYNRSMRKRLPFYIWKWSGIAFCLMQIMQLLSIDAGAARIANDSQGWLTAFATCAGIGFAFACTVIALLSTSYLFLTFIKK